MSKEAALRAMREARYAERQKRAAGAATSTATRAKTRPPVAPPLPKATPAAAAAAAPASDALCGHKSMNGRTCTREQGHPQKNHRYS